MNHPPISVEQYSETEFTVRFFGLAHIATVVTSSAAYATLWVSDFLSAYDDNDDDDPSRFWVGLDVKYWRPANNGVAVLQLCVDRRCLVFQILRCGAIPNALSDFLSDERFTFIGVKIHEDVRRLTLDYDDVWVGNVMDLRTLLVVVERERVAARRAELWLARAILLWRARNQSCVQMENWEEDHLSFEQIMCACMDAFIPFEMARRLLG